MSQKQDAAAGEFNDDEIAQRRDEVLKRMLHTPPKPHIARPPVRQNRKKAGDDQPTPDRGKSAPQT